MTSFYKSKRMDETPLRVNKEEFSSENEFVIKALYIGVSRLKQMSSVLEYSVQLSWFSRLKNSNKGGKPGGGPKPRKPRKNKNKKKPAV